MTPSRATALAGKASRTAIAYLQDLFASAGDGLNATKAGRAEALVGDPPVNTAAIAALVDDLLHILGADTKRGA